MGPHLCWRVGSPEPLFTGSFVSRHQAKHKLVDTVNAGCRQRRGMAYDISMTSRGSLEKHLRIGTPNRSMVQRRLQKFFSLPLYYSLIRMILFSSNQAHLESSRKPGTDTQLGRKVESYFSSDLDGPTGPILVFGPCPQMGYPPRRFMSSSDRLKLA